jgi:hypothetical protein
MVDVAGGSSSQIRVFRTRAVVVAGLVDVVAGTAMLGTGIWLAWWRGGRDGLPLGLALAVVGSFILLSGVGRVTSRMELGGTHVAWRWAFSRFDVALNDLVDAAVVEKGSPTSGASWAGFLGGGPFGALVWWLMGLAAALLSSEPSLGAFELVVIKQYGGAVPVKPISTWSNRTSHSQANDAARAVKKAIDSSRQGTRPAPQPASLRYDAWDVARDA